jgi:hypothetical protein
MTILSPTQLETADYTMPGWVHIFNKNVDLLNTKLLNILELGDVNPDYVPDDGFLVWNAATSRWKVKNY